MTKPSLAAVLALSTGLHVLAAAQVFTIPAIAPAMASSMGVAEFLVGAQVIVVYAVAMLASFISGSIVVRLGPVRATQLSLVGAAAGLACAAIPSVPAVALASVVLGAAYGLVNPATGQMLESAIDPARRAMAFSAKQSAVPVGGMLAGAIAPWVAVSLGWRGALWTMAAAAVLGALLLEWLRAWFPFSPPAAGTHRIRVFGDVGIIWRIPSLRYLCLAVMGFSGSQLILTTYLVTILVEHVGLGLVVAGMALSLFNGGGMAGRFGWGLVADAIRSGSRLLPVMFGASVFLLAVFPFVTAAWPLVLVYVFAALLGITVAGWTGVFISEVLRLAPPGESARAIAGCYVFTFGGGLGGLACFLLGAQLLRSYGATIWILVAITSAGFLLSFKVLALSRQAQHAPPASMSEGATN